VYKRKDPALHGATTAGFPLGCAIACRVMDLLETEWQSGSFARRERLLFKGLTKMQAADPDRIRQIVVKGLVGGIRFYHADQASDFFHLAGRAGVLLHRFETTQGSSEWLAIFPPLLATEKEIVDGISLLMQCQPALQQSKFFIDK
jgi:acetylornithine/succinyldiaminopimelate/putrescine aminotransferase